MLRVESGGMNPNWAEVLTALAAMAAVPFAAFAWFTSAETRRHSMRPVLRPVSLRLKTTNALVADVFKLKNYGLGPAVGVMLFDIARGADAAVMGEYDVIEPLGDGFIEDEGKRIGNVHFQLGSGYQLSDGRTYRILYQDIEAAWHETQFSITTGNLFSAKYLGRKRWWKHGRPTPKAALDRALVVRAEELM
jgi:hypothetical protein